MAKDLEVIQVVGRTATCKRDDVMDFQGMRQATAQAAAFVPVQRLQARTFPAAPA